MEAQRVTLQTMYLSGGAVGIFDSKENHRADYENVNMFDRFPDSNEGRLTDGMPTSITSLDNLLGPARPYTDVCELMRSLESVGLQSIVGGTNVRERIEFRPELLSGVVEVHKLLGCGNFSEVFHCSFRTQREQVEQVAIKILDQPPSINDTEAAILQNLEHPNLVSLVDVIEGTQVAIVLEFCHGGDLQTLIHSSSNRELVANLQLRTCVQAMIGIVSAVEYLHSLEIIHRDIKSGNCFLAQHMVNCELPDMKLGDLGFARYVSNTSMTRWKGTVRYMAPEVITSESYDVSADIFSCGVMFHELLSRKVPYSSSGFRDEILLALAISEGLLPEFNVLRNSLLGSKREAITEMLTNCWVAPPLRSSASTFVQGLGELLKN